MQKDLDIWQLILDCKQKGITIGLMLVLDSAGSSPGRQGFKMAVASDGRLAGSIGGGIMEYELVELLRTQTWHQHQKAESRQLVHRKKLTDSPSGMICSGEQSVVLYPDCFLSEELATETCMAIENYQVESITFNTTEIKINAIDEPILSSYNKDIKHWQYIESIGKHETAYVIGGGHVGLVMSQLLKYLGFYVVTFDERENVITMERNTVSDEKIICSYDDLGKHIKSGDLSFVIVMSFSFLTDVKALSAILNGSYKYLGVMGSKVKTINIFQALSEKGFTQESINKITAPIGIDINSQTPQEIAVSIAAEIIQIKNANLPKGDR
ncbi:XdhC family protein [Francisellaceae bacterium]|nr:XdhC family protein [Francisellaceae bacterium]